MIIKTTLVALTIAAASAPVAFAKGHDQGFGAMLAGSLPAGAVAEGQRPNEEGSYGQRDAKAEAQAGTQDNSEVARTKDASHPSRR